MTKILIGYGTTEGQTARIAARLADVIRSHGLDVQTADLKQSPDADLDTYDAVIIGGSIHMGKHEDYVCDFVRQNRAGLERLPAAFFSVSLAAHGDMANAEAYVELRAGNGLASLASRLLQRRPSLPSVRLPQAVHDEADRPQQARQLEYRHLT